MGRNVLKLSTKGFEQLITKLDGINGNVHKAVTDALEQAGETIGADTKTAIEKSNLPAGGKFSKGDTEKSIIMHPHVNWSGTLAEIGVGFNFGKPGAGGFLITGTPRMKPNYKLQEIYKKKKYMTQIQNSMKKTVNDYIQQRMEGGDGR